MRTSDGREVLGATPEEIVRDLRRGARAPARSVREFMYQAAGRASTLTGKRVRCDTFANFIEDMLAAGLLIDETAAAPKDECEDL